MKISSISLGKSLVTISESAEMAEAQDLMDERRIRHLPVIDAAGQVVGLLSERDVRRAMNPRNPGFIQGLKAKDFMSTPVVTVDENTSISDVAEGMIDEKVSSFLVTGKGQEVIGIVTTEDLLRHLVKLLGADKGETLRSLPYSPVISEAIRELNAAGI